MLEKVELSGKRVVLRVDLNIPKPPKVYAWADDTPKEEIALKSKKVEEAVDAIRYLRSRGASVVIISHFDRPRSVQTAYSLRFMVKPLTDLLEEEVSFASVEEEVLNNPIVLLENLRFNKGEEENDLEFAKLIARWGDIYVNNAFSCCHRKHASIDGITKFLPSYPGLALLEELKYLRLVVQRDRDEKVYVIVGGFKTSSKLQAIRNLLPIVDKVMIGGAIAITFFHALGHYTASSFIEQGVVPHVRDLYKEYGHKIVLPIDVMTYFNNKIHHTSVENMPQRGIIHDIGPRTAALFADVKGTVLWNGPMGQVENPTFAKGTITLGKILSNKTAAGDIISIVGGGETSFALSGQDYKFSHFSTAGGALLEWMESFTLPGLEALKL